jgi:hypothetical protein
MTQSEAKHLLRILWPGDSLPYLQEYADAIARKEGYKPRSWLQAVGWIAAGGEETFDVNKTLAKASAVRAKKKH